MTLQSSLAVRTNSAVGSVLGAANWAINISPIKSAFQLTINSNTLVTDTLVTSDARTFGHSIYVGTVLVAQLFIFFIAWLLCYALGVVYNFLTRRTVALWPERRGFAAMITFQWIANGAIWTRKLITCTINDCIAKLANWQTNSIRARQLAVGAFLCAISFLIGSVEQREIANEAAIKDTITEPGFGQALFRVGAMEEVGTVALILKHWPLVGAIGSKLITSIGTIGCQIAHP